MSQATLAPFQPEFANPHTRGWGGTHIIEWFATQAWVTTGFVLLLMLLHNYRGAPSILLDYCWLWLPPYLYYSISFVKGDIRFHCYSTLPPPCVVCDPQGLTIYRAKRIRYQWRWQQLKSVSRHGILKTLRIESQDGAVLDYRHKRLEREYDTYAQIERVAQDYLRGMAPSLPPQAPPGLDYRCHSARLATGHFASLSCGSPFAFLFLLFLGKNMNPWAYGAAVPLLLQLFYVVAMTLIIAAIGALVIFIVRAYRAYFYPPEKKILVHINCHGIYFFRGKNSKRTLYWQDLRAARAESIPSGKGGSAYYLAIHDRLDHEYWIYIGLPQAKQRSEEIAAIINAVLAEKPLPNIMPAVADKPARRTMYGLFWLSAVFTLLIMCLFFLMNGKALPETTRHFFATFFFMALLLVTLCTYLICILFADED